MPERERKREIGGRESERVRRKKTERPKERKEERQKKKTGKERRKERQVDGRKENSVGHWLRVEVGELDTMKEAERERANAPTTGA